MNPRLAWIAAVTLAAANALAQSQPSTIAYTVRAGDTCPSIARTVYGDPGRIDLVHLHNRLGALPHRLRAGTILQLPRSAGPTRVVADANITHVQNQVQAFTPQGHSAQRNEPLGRGHRVSTETSSSAEVTFSNESQIQLGERSLVVVLGGLSGEVHRGSAADTFLQRGSLLGNLAALTGHPAAPVATAATVAAAAPPAVFSVQTPAARVALSPGRARLDVDANRRTTVAVYHGHSRVTAAGRSVDVSEGFGNRTDMGRRPGPPTALPPAPIWRAPAQVLVMIDEGTASLTGTFAAGNGRGAAPVAWHVELARDESFNDHLVDRRVPAAVTTLGVENAVVGRYYARVSAIDADGLEGSPSAVHVTRVARLSLRAGREGERASISVEAGLFCSVDDGAFALVTPASDSQERLLPLRPWRRHVIRCAVAADGVGAASREVPAEATGPAILRAQLGPIRDESEAGASRTVDVRLIDAVGDPVDDSGIDAVVSGAAESLEGWRRVAPGRYTGTLRWRQAQPAARLQVRWRAAPGVAPAPLGDTELTAVPAPTRPPSYVERWSESGWDVAAAFTSALGVARPMIALGAWAEGRYRVALGESRFGFVVGLRTGYLAASCSGAVPSSGGPHCTGSGNETLRTDALQLTVPLALQVRVGPGSFVPYVQIQPGLFVLRVEAPTFPGAAQPGFLFQVAIGFQFRLGPGGLFGEVGYQLSAGGHDRQQIPSLDGPALALGYRLRF